MKTVRFVAMALALAGLMSLGGPALAAQVDCDAVYCFTAQDFSQSEEPVRGICITALPQESGAVMLGSRILRAGDILTAEQLSQMTFAPAESDLDAEAVVSYLPIYEDRVEGVSAMTISIRGKKNEAPVAQDSAVETYKNVPNEGTLKATDPEGEALTFTLIRAPKRGSVELGEDGSFLYTPKKNKVGVDSFVYTATDPAGNVSREATVTVQILKPTQAKQYTDTIGLSCRFEAEWLRNTGLFVGESVNGQACFQPDKTVSRGEFVAMVVKSLDIPTDEQVYASIPAETPDWLKPYLAAAIRSGMTAELPDVELQTWAQETVSGAEAAVMLQNVLDLSVSQQALETAALGEQTEEAWAATALLALRDHGIDLTGCARMTRAEAAELLYQASLLALDAPGTAVLRKQQ